MIGLFLGLGAREGALQACSTRSASRCRTAASIFATRTVIVSLLVGIVVTLAREPAAGDPRDARAADRRGARGRDAAAVALRALPHCRVGDRHRARLRRAAALRPASARASGRRASSSGWASARSLIFIGVCAARRCRTSCRPARLASLGWPGDRASAASAGSARARQRAPQPAADRVDRGRADDRARARHARRRARLRHHRVVPRRRRTSSGRTPTTRSPRRTTSRRSRSPRPTRSRRCPASRRSATSAPATRRAFGKSFFATASTRPAASDVQARLEVEGSQAVLAHARRRTARSSTTATRRSTTCTLGLADRADVLERRAARRFMLQGDLQPARPAARRSARVTISQTTLGRYNPNPQNLYSFVRMRGGVTPRTRAALDSRARGRSRTRRRRRGSSSSTTRQRRSTRILNMLYVLLALSVDRQPVRDRQHARADGVRAHARDRHAARDRHDAPPGAPDDPARERDHRADRRRRSASCSGSCSAACSSAGVDFIVFSLPVGLADRVRDRGDRRRASLAAIFPARRAARLNVLEALQYE